MSDLEVARRYADAYAGFDRAALLEVLSPELLFRQINPGGYLEFGSATAYVDATESFLDGFDSVAPAGATAEAMADVILTTSRLELVLAGERYLMQHSEIVTVSGGQVTEIDSVCTGAR